MTDLRSPLRAELLTLLDIDQLDRAILRCQEAREELRRLSRHDKSDAETLKAQLHQLEADLEAHTLLQASREKDLKRTEAHIGRIKDFEHVTNEKELEAAQRELENQRQHRDEVELALLEGYDVQASLEDARAKTQHKLNHLKARYAEAQPQRKERFEALGLEIERIQADRAQQLPRLVGELRDAYDRAYVLHQGRAVTDVENDRCTPCNLSVPPQHVVNILLGRSFHTCAHCGRLILPVGGLGQL